MSGLKNNITDQIWIDQYPDGSMRIIDDGMKWETDRVEINMTKQEFLKLVGTYLKEDADWIESMELTEDEKALVQIGR